MSRKLYKYILPFFLAILLVGATAPDDDKEKNRFLLNLIMHSIENLHYNNVKVDDDFSEKAFDMYLQNLDYNKKFLIQSDIDKLSEYKTKIDDELQNGTYNLLELSSGIIKKRIDEAEKYYTDILKKPFDFTIDETIQLDNDKTTYAKSKEELKEAWRLSLKYQTLTRLHTLLEEQETKKEKGEEGFEEKSLKELEKEAREKVRKSNENWFRRMHQLEREDRLSSYLNSVLSIYDPHTTYFPPKEKEDFDIGISGRLEGIGATLQEKDGYIKVVRIVPGSASWKQGELKSGDIILKVGQGEEDPVDVVDMRLDHAVELIRGPKGTEVRLTVKKLDGSIVVIPIIRDVVILEETYAKSAIVEYEGKRVGYIFLPKFYMDFTGNGGRACADDIEKELEKLAKEDIKGIIIDLRNNGGGSLQQVVDMSGLFIKEGPIVQVKSKMWPSELLNDEDTTVQYSGPLMVMVNSFSASASEILAAAMQDYRRAVIVGTPTFGKGTVQSFVGLDDILNPGYSHYKPLGALKLTTQKFYRVNGGATQIKGVVPDIELPDAYSYLDVGERENEYALPWDEVEKSDYDLWDKPISNKLLKTLSANSTARIKSNNNFQLIQENALRLKEQTDNTVVNLNLEKFRQEQKEIKEQSKKYDNLLEEPLEGFEISALQADMPVYAADSSKNARAQEWFEDLSKDVYLKESVNIMGDIY